MLEHVQRTSFKENPLLWPNLFSKSSQLSSEIEIQYIKYYKEIDFISNDLAHKFFSQHGLDMSHPKICCISNLQ